MGKEEKRMGTEGVLPGEHSPIQNMNTILAYLIRHEIVENVDSSGHPATVSGPELNWWELRVVPKTSSNGPFLRCELVDELGFLDEFDFSFDPEKHPEVIAGELVEFLELSLGR